MATTVGRRRWLIVAALVFTGFSMRTAVVSIGPVLSTLQRVFGMSSAVSGALTTLPVLCFATLGAATLRPAARIGPRKLLVVSLLAMSAGLVGRATVASLPLFFVLSLVALSGGAVANVVLPMLIKEEMPDRIGPLTALYTAMMATGMTASAGLTVPVGALAPATDSWRAGLAFWALFSLVAVAPWLTMLRRDTSRRVRGVSIFSVRHSPTARWLTLFFATQAFQAYVAIGWFAKLLHSHGMSVTEAGLMLAILTAVTVPVYMAFAAVPAHRHRLAIAATLVAYLISDVGLLLAPVRLAWLWMVLAGVGGGEFPMALVMIGLRSRDSRTTGALSAFVQSAGYLLGALGPLTFGVLEQASGSWTVPVLALIAAACASAVFGWLAARPRIVDDELGAPASARPSG